MQRLLYFPPEPHIPVSQTRWKGQGWVQRDGVAALFDRRSRAVCTELNPKIKKQRGFQCVGAPKIVSKKHTRRNLFCAVCCRPVDIARRAETLDEIEGDMIRWDQEDLEGRRD